VNAEQAKAVFRPQSAAARAPLQLQWQTRDGALQERTRHLEEGARRRSTATARRAALERRRVTLAVARRAHREVEEGHCAAGSGCREHSGGIGPDRRRSRAAGRCARRRE